jgi:hypothetical protein
MNIFMLSLIAENSRLCHMADKPDGAAKIVDIYRKQFEKMPHSTLEAIADIARFNVTVDLDNCDTMREVNARRGYDN